jgi:hypothetical protein
MPISNATKNLAGALRNENIGFLTATVDSFSQALAQMGTGSGVPVWHIS